MSNPEFFTIPHRSDSRSAILLERILACSQPASSCSVMGVNGKLVGWLLHCLFLPSLLLPAPGYRKIIQVLLPREACKTGHTLTCLHVLPGNLQKGKGRDVVGWQRKQPLEDALLCVICSVSSPPWKPALCCLVAVPQGLKHSESHTWNESQRHQALNSEKWANVEFQSYEDRAGPRLSSPSGLELESEERRFLTHCSLVLDIDHGVWNIPEGQSVFSGAGP